jgi:adenylate cyclase
LPTLVERLKKKKIVQWTLGYLAGAYGVLEVVDLVADPLGLTDAFKLAVLVLLTFGVGAALVLAWFHAEKGRQRVSPVEIGLLAVLLVGGISSSAIAYRRGAPQAEAGVTDVVSMRLSGPVIAVLPFDDASSAEEGAGFIVDGIHSQIVTSLSQLSGMNTISRASVMATDRTTRTISQVAQELGASAILEGQIQKVGDALHINVSLIDAASGISQWAEVYDAVMDPESVFAVQGEIASAIAEALAVTLAPDERAGLASVPTHDRVAADFYMRGQEAEDRADRGETDFFSTALEFYDQAAAQDPFYADAHAARSRMIWSLYWKTDSPRTPEAVESIRAAAQRALDLNPNLAAGHLMLGEYFRSHTRDAAAAVESFQRANRLDPDNVRTLAGLAYMNMQVGDFALAQSNLDRAIELDPRDGVAQRLAGSLAFYMRRYEDAELHVRRAARRFSPTFEDERPDPATFPLTRFVYRIQIGTYLAADGDTRRAYEALTDLMDRTDMSSLDVSMFLGDFGDPLGIPDPPPIDIGHTMLTMDAVQAYLHLDSMRSDARATLLALSGEDVDEQRRLWSSWGDTHSDDLYGGAGDQVFNDPWEEVDSRSRVALAFARAGRSEDALAQMNRARRLVDSFLLVESELLAEPRWAMTLVVLGEDDQALDMLEDMMSRPSAISRGLLRVQPEWDPIREHPRFQALLNSR